MPRNYRLVLLDDATPGMVLSDNLLDRHGKVLLSEGTLLNDKLLESLRRYDIEMIPVFTVDLTEEEKAVRAEQREERLNRLFRKENYGEPAENANDVLREYLREYRRGGSQ